MNILEFLFITYSSQPFSYNFHVICGICGFFFFLPQIPLMNTDFFRFSDSKKLLSVDRCLLTFKPTFNFPFSVFNSYMYVPEFHLETSIEVTSSVISCVILIRLSHFVPPLSRSSMKVCYSRSYKGNMRRDWN